MMERILFRTDATSNIGVGHLMRCIALAQQMKDHGVSVCFLTFVESDDLVQRLQAEEFKVIRLDVDREELGKAKDLNLTMNFIEELNPEWVVLDNYYFGSGYQKDVSSLGAKTLLIDDIAQNEVFCDVLLNHGIQAADLAYSTLKKTKRLLGPDYALLRKEFLLDENSRARSRGTDNILITLGGGEHEGNTKKIIDGLSCLTDINVRVIAGMNFRIVNSLKRYTETRNSFEILPFTPEMKEHYDWADITISAGGGTCLELCYHGITGLLGIVSDNQSVIVSTLGEKGAFHSVGWFGDCSVEQIRKAFLALVSDREGIQRMRDTQRSLVDGKGAERVYECLENI